jgi:hypothetical protein
VAPRDGHLEITELVDLPLALGSPRVEPVSWGTIKNAYR